MPEEYINISLISIESANIETELLYEDWTLRDLHVNCGAFVLLNKKHVILTADTPILNVILINNVSIKILSYIIEYHNASYFSIGETGQIFHSSFIAEYF